MLNEKSIYLSAKLFMLSISAFLLLFFNSITFSSDFNYKERGNREIDNRMEGVKNFIPSSSLDLQLLSFISYQDITKLSSAEKIKIGFYIWSNESIFITARELVPVHNYFMRPLRHQWPKGWQVYSSWPRSEVLAPLRIDPNRLGIVARLTDDEDGSGYIAPIIYYVNDHPARFSSYRLVIASRETLSSLSYTLAASKSGKILLERELETEFTAGIPIPVTLDLQNQPPGLFKLSIMGKIKGKNDGPRRTYYFFHQPSLNPPQ